MGGSRTSPLSGDMGLGYRRGRNLIFGQMVKSYGFDQNRITSHPVRSMVYLKVG